MYFKERHTWISWVQFICVTSLPLMPRLPYIFYSSLVFFSPYFLLWTQQLSSLSFHSWAVVVNFYLFFFPSQSDESFHQSLPPFTSPDARIISPYAPGRKVNERAYSALFSQSPCFSAKRRRLFQIFFSPCDGIFSFFLRPLSPHQFLSLSPPPAKRLGFPFLESPYDPLFLILLRRTVSTRAPPKLFFSLQESLGQ